MSHQAAARIDSFIAYRGLWDKYADPRSLGAVRRAYLRGIPCLVEIRDGISLAEMVTLASDASVNRRMQPLYLVTDGHPAALGRQRPGPSWLEIFAIDRNHPEDSARPLYRWRRPTWVLAGCHLTIAVARRGLTSEDFGSCERNQPTVLVESTSVIADVATRSAFATLDDDVILGSVRAIAGESAHIGRVSDVVEFDLLLEQIREAA